MRCSVRLLALGLLALGLLALGLLALGLLTLGLLTLALRPGRLPLSRLSLELAALTALGLAGPPGLGSLSALELAALGTLELTALPGLALLLCLRPLRLCLRPLRLRALALTLGLRSAASAEAALTEPEAGPVGQIGVLDRLRDRSRFQIGGGEHDHLGGGLNLRGQIHLVGILPRGDDDLAIARRRQQLARLLGGASGQRDAGGGRPDRQRHTQRQQQRLGRPADHRANAHPQVFAVFHAVTSPS